MKILVTGHKGFIGQNLCIYLIERGYEVEGYEYIENVLPDCSQYDRVVHLGAISSTTEKDVEKVMQQNLDFSHRLIQLCDMQGVDLIYASSASVYGDTTHFTEDGPLIPQSPYAWCRSKFPFSPVLYCWLQSARVSRSSTVLPSFPGPSRESASRLHGR